MHAARALHRLLTVLIGAIAAIGVTLCAAVPAQAQGWVQDGYGPYDGAYRRRAQRPDRVLVQSREEYHALNLSLSGRLALDFAITPMGAVFSGGAEGHRALDANYDQLFSDGLGFHVEARHHRPLNRWFSVGPLATFQYVTHKGTSHTGSGGTLTTRGLDQSRLIAGGFLRLQPGSPLRKARFSLSLSAQFGLGYLEAVDGNWTRGGSPVSPRVELYDDSAVFIAELQAKVALTFRASNYARWGLAIWVGWNHSTAPREGRGNAAIG
ncbi:MAG: hypothetical protein ACYTGX_18435, partial [Planctomycetota bacterium]